MGAWIETRLKWIKRIRFGVAPLWVRGLKLRCYNLLRFALRVAPLWVRGLKRLLRDFYKNCALRRTLVGAWIETRFTTNSFDWLPSRTLVGAWIETRMV